MQQPISFAALALANAFTALGSAAAYVAYASGDSSGLQYMALLPAFFFSVSGAIAFAIILLVKGRRVRPYLGVAAAAMVVALLPEITGMGYNSEVIDGPGAVAAVLLLCLQIGLVLQDWSRTRRAGV